MAVPDESVVVLIEALAEELVLTSVSDLPALAALHTKFQEVERAVDGSGRHVAAQAAKAAADLLEKLVLFEVNDTARAMATLEETVSALQMIFRDGREEDGVIFPDELGLNAAPPEPETPPSPATSPPPRTPRPPKRREEDEPPSAVLFSDADIEAQKGIGGFVMSPLVDARILSDFVVRQPGVMEEMENLVLSLESGATDAKTGGLRRLVHTLKGEAALVGFSDVERVCHALEDALGEVAVGNLIDILLAVKDWLLKVFEAFMGHCDPPEPGDSHLRRIEEARGKVRTSAEAAKAEKASSKVPEAIVPGKLTGDLDLIGEFISEAREHLQNADVHLLTVETEPKNEDAVNAVFRAFHTIKGVAGFLELTQIQRLAHEAENLLDKARKGDVELTGGIMDITFESVDMMRRLVDRVSDALTHDVPLEAEAGIDDLAKKLKTAVAGGIIELRPAPLVPVRDGQRMGEILLETGCVTHDELKEVLDKQEHRTPESICEILVREVSISRAQLDQALAHQLEHGGEIENILIELAFCTQADIDTAMALRNVKPRLGEILVRSQKVEASDIAQALRAQNAQQVRKSSVEVREAVRVDALRLDRLVDLIGELVIAESMVSQAPELRQSLSGQLARHMGQLDKITRELQEMGTSLRMVPVRATFQKMARLVRDLAKKSDKRIEFVSVGDDTELDKTVVDKIGDPLVHMVRNSVDHGMESTPQERLVAGKSEIGRVELRAFHRGGCIFIEIEDDGRGLDRDAIIRKAIERGLVREGDSINDRDVWMLIFEPGFSTAKQVTDVSGRGVGMDVVRKNIDALRGQIEITTVRGKGTTFSIRLPLTLAIIDGMVVRVGGERYIIPTLSVIRSVQPTSTELFTVIGQGEMLSLQGQLVPLFRLGRIFAIEGACPDPTHALVVIVEDDGKQAGILVDELLGQQQTVIKSLGESMQGIPGVAGGAIMSDGHVGLIIDVGGIVRLANA